MKRPLLAIVVACSIVAPALAAQKIDNAEWGFRVSFPGDVTQKVTGDGLYFVAYSADGAYGLSVARHREPLPDPAATVDFMTKPIGSSETVVASKSLPVSGAVGREVTILKKRSAVSMESGYEIRRVYVRGNMVYRVDADYPEGGSDVAARAFVESFSLR